MKKIKFNKKNKILFFCILNIIIINVIYTYQDYQNEKNKPGNLSYTMNIVKNINNDLSYQYISLEDIIKSNLRRSVFVDMLAFDSSLTPLINSNFNDCEFAYGQKDEYGQFNNLISLADLDYQTLNKISRFLKDLAQEQEKAIATFNYDTIKEDGTIIVNKLTYFAINDFVFYNNSHNNLIEKEITYLITPTGEYNIDDDGVAGFNNYRLIVYDYLEKCLKNARKNNKFDDNGYYEIINPSDNDFLHPMDYTDENNNQIKTNIKICCQILDYKYGSYYKNNNSDEKLYQPDSGYIVWYEYYMDKDIYTFSSYFSNHYYNYLISLIIIVGNYFIIKKILNKKTEPITVKEEPLELSKSKREILNKEPVDLEKLLTDLYNNSKNLLIFKKLNLNYSANNLTVLGNKDELTKVINDIFYFIIKHTNFNNTLTIKIENKTIYFINNNHSITNKELEELNEVFEIIEAHDFKYECNLNNNSYQIIINTI